MQDFARTDENENVLIKEFDLAELDVFNSYVIQKRNQKALVLQVFSVSKVCNWFLDERIEFMFRGRVLQDYELLISVLVCCCST